MTWSRVMEVEWGTSPSILTSTCVGGGSSQPQASAALLDGKHLLVPIARELSGLLSRCELRQHRSNIGPRSFAILYRIQFCCAGFSPHERLHCQNAVCLSGQAGTQASVFSQAQRYRHSRSSSNCKFATCKLSFIRVQQFWLTLSYVNGVFRLHSAQTLGCLYRRLSQQMVKQSCVLWNILPCIQVGWRVRGALIQFVCFYLSSLFNHKNEGAIFFPNFDWFSCDWNLWCHTNQNSLQFFHRRDSNPTFSNESVWRYCRSDLLGEEPNNVCKLLLH